MPNLFEKIRQTLSPDSPEFDTPENAEELLYLVLEIPEGQWKIPENHSARPHVERITDYITEALKARDTNGLELKTDSKKQHTFNLLQGIWNSMRKTKKDIPLRSIQTGLKALFDPEIKPEKIDIENARDFIIGYSGHFLGEKKFD